MNIYIDESGSFANASKTDAWSVVAAIAVSETEEEKLSECLIALKAKNGSASDRELKINGVTEESYADFLVGLGTLNLVLFGTGFDAGVDNDEFIRGHQQNQVMEILSHLDEMMYEGGRQGLLLMAAQLEKLPPQLYAQLFCQVRLMYEVVARIITYFAQCIPETISAFRWRVDAKNISRTNFEDVFEKISPVLLQTMSITKPMAMVHGFDYSGLERYYGEIPEYLQEVLGGERREALNVQKIIREDIQFLDSKNSRGIHVADLVVSGVRKCLRRQFADNEKMAALLGRLMLQAKYNGPPLNLITFASDRHKITAGTTQLMRIMIGHCKPMLTKRGR